MANTNTDYMEFGFGSGDDSVGKTRFEKFKGKEGESYRMGFVYWPELNGKLNLDAPSPRFVGAKRYFIQNVGYVIDNGHPELARLAGQASKQTVATLIALWPVDRKGKLSKERFMTGEVEIRPWIFSTQTYEQLKRRHDEFPFGTNDINCSCSDTQFQKMDYTPASNSLLRSAIAAPQNKVMVDLVDHITAKVREIGPQLVGMIGQALTIEKVREKLGGGSPTSHGPGPSSVDLTTEMDGVLDDILDA